MRTVLAAGTIISIATAALAPASAQTAANSADFVRTFLCFTPEPNRVMYDVSVGRWQNNGAMLVRRYSKSIKGKPLEIDRRFLARDEPHYVGESDEGKLTHTFSGSGKEGGRKVQVALTFTSNGPASAEFDGIKMKCQQVPSPWLERELFPEMPPPPPQE